MKREKTTTRTEKKHGKFFPKTPQERELEEILKHDDPEVIGKLMAEKWIKDAKEYVKRNKIIIHV